MKIILKDGTGSIDLKYLSAEPDRWGNMRLYLRRGGRRIRMKETVGTDAFLAEYKAAFAAPADAPRAAPAQPKTRGTFRWLVEQYVQSADYKRLNVATRTMRRRQLEEICAKHGAKPIAQMEVRHVRNLRDEKADVPHAANNRLKTLRVMFGWAVEAGHMERNPARDVDKVKIASDGHHTWTVSEIKQFLVRHPLESKAGLALALLLYTGVRRSDVVQLGRQMETDDGYIRFIERKGERRQVKVRELPMLPALRAALSLHRTTNLTYLTTMHGKPFSVAGFGNWFRDRCNEAGLAHCSAHGLRKAGATIAAENGATEHQLMALFGWKTSAMATHYTRKANMKRLAGEAAGLVALDQKQNVSVAPSEEFPAVRQKGGKK